VTPATRQALIAQYARGPARLEAVLATVPEEARTWRPAPGKWSVHEVIVHCADSETSSHARIRFLLAEKDPLILGYDQDRWAIELDYHTLPLGPALETIRAVRANTVPLLLRMSEAQWQKSGRHTEHPSYGATRWLEIYGEHLEVHARQIERNLAAWNTR
jgi:hypothetical protein